VIVVVLLNIHTALASTIVFEGYFHLHGISHAWLLERLTLSYHAALRLVSSKKKQVVVQDAEQVIFE
jgi:hypothetical protein